jgi:hypothetical protein
MSGANEIRRVLEGIELKQRKVANDSATIPTNK